jgi:hypothetical protein
MTGYSLPDLIALSQQSNVNRYTISGLDSSFGSALGLWGSHRAAVSAGINLLNGTLSALPVTINCPDSEV